MTVARTWRQTGRGKIDSSHTFTALTSPAIGDCTGHLEIPITPLLVRSLPVFVEDIFDWLCIEFDVEAVIPQTGFFDEAPKHPRLLISSKASCCFADSMRTVSWRSCS